MVDVRATLETLIRERGEDYASLSRLLGRNAAYMQQFIRRGVPKKLDEADRRTLARYFRIDEALLGGPSPSANALVPIGKLAVGASAGPGSFDADERYAGAIAFDAATLRAFGLKAENLSIIRVVGDSMTPTLSDGDDIVVDRSDTGAALRDGIYVIRHDGVLNVKRIARAPDRRISVTSDNSSYPAWPPLARDEVDIVGRVVWMGRRLR